MQQIEPHWVLYGVIALAALLVVWWILSRSSKRTRDRSYRPDVLDEGVGPAARNQALIDAAPAAQVVMPPPMGDALGGMAEIVAVAAQDEVEEAGPLEEVEPAPPPAPEPEPVVEAAPQPAPAPPPPPPVAEASTGDDLSKIKGLGPKLQALLPTLGLSTYAQIAALSEADLTVLDAQLGPFAGRPARDGWVEQAKYLAAGDVAGFEARFGKV